MSDRPKNSPIKIPINFVDSSPALEREGVEPYDDAIEIDGDALDFDKSADAPQSEQMPAESSSDETAEETASDAVASVDAEPEDVPGEPEAADPDVEIAEEPPRAEELSTSQPAPAGDAANAGRPELSLDAFTRLTQELRQKTELADRLAAEKNDLFDRLLRKQAEFENFRKRMEREMQEAYRRARADILLDILPSIDNIERALQHADAAEAGVLQEGLALIYKQLADTLGRHGLEPIDSIGKPFDPELHEAVAAEANDEVADHTVLDEFQRGYKLGDRLLRPARVKVSVQS
jgi:molecular chaperone GrpE